MGKKHRNPTPSTPADTAPEQLETQAAAELAAGRFRKARDLYKELCKRDRQKHLPRLIEANRSLADQMLARGQVSEAQQVLAYLASIAPAGELLGFGVQASLAAKDWTKAGKLAADLFQTALGTPAPRDRSLVADALVLAFPTQDESPVSLPREVGEELAAIIGSLLAISERRFDDAQALLRPLPRNSLFADWKILAKAWIAFYSGEKPKAANLFALLPPKSAPGRAATPFLPFLSVEDPLNGSDRPHVIAQICEISGHRHLGSILARADQFWQIGRYLDSLKEMRRASSFPSEAADLAGVLSDFYFRAQSNLPQQKADGYIIGMHEIVMKEALKSAVERRLFWRTLGQDALLAGAIAQAEEGWRNFLAACPPEAPRTARLGSLIHFKLGEWGSLEMPTGGFFHLISRKPRLRDAAAAIHELEKSISLDPSHLAAHLLLLKVYENEKRTSERNRLLDEMARRFPEEKTVLFQTGRGCVDRGAFQKGLDALERARALDPLDPEISRELARGCLQMGRQHYQKKNAAKARLSFQRAETYAHRESSDLHSGLQMMRARQAALEMLFGDKEAALPLMETARAAPTTFPAWLYMAHASHRVYARAQKSDSPFWKELQSATAASPESRRLLLETFEFRSEGHLRLLWGAERKHVVTSLKAAAGATFSREEAGFLCDRLFKSDDFGQVVDLLVKAGLRADPEDPMFLLYEELHQMHPFLEPNWGKIEAIRDAATRRGDTRTARLATETLDSRESDAFFGNAAFPGDEFDDDGLPVSPDEILRQLLELTEKEESAGFKDGDLPKEFLPRRPEKQRKTGEGTRRANPPLDKSQLDLF